MENTHYSVVANEAIIKNFLKDVGVEDMKPTESFLVQTSFRCKKFTDVERHLLKNYAKDSYMTKALKLSKSGSFNYESAINHLYELEVPVRACTYNIGPDSKISFPQRAFVTYVMPNPTDEVWVANMHNQKFMKQVSELTMSPINDSEEHKAFIQTAIARSNKDWRSERATCIHTNYVNFDIDFEFITGYVMFERSNFSDTAQKIKDCFHADEVEIILIICEGGLHILVPKNLIQENPHDICKRLENIFERDGVEVEFKGGKSYVPLPGTYQYGNSEDHIVQYVKI